jgi:hypothetical protein
VVEASAASAAASASGLALDRLLLLLLLLGVVGARRRGGNWFPTGRLSAPAAAACHDDPVFPGTCALHEMNNDLALASGGQDKLRPRAAAGVVVMMMEGVGARDAADALPCQN